MPPITGPFPLANVEMPTWVLRFDKNGACTSPATRALLLDLVKQGGHSDIILFSHGWNNDFDDATDMYARFLREFEARVKDRPVARNPSSFTPLFVGVTWPSIWLSFDSGPKIAGAGDAAPTVAVEDNLAAQALADRVADEADAQVVERLYALLAKPSLDDAEARELAELAAPAFGDVTDDETSTTRETTPEDLLSMMREMQEAESGSTTARRSIDDWDETPAGNAPATEPQTAGLLSRLDPRQALRLFSVYQMKDRAGVVGARGIAALLRDLLAAAPESTRVHAVGHSYGCKVMLSAICSPAPMPRQLHSLLLLQPAVSHLCFAEKIPKSGKSGGYREALKRVKAPILTTYSNRDFALNKTFHLALRRASDLGEQDIGIAADSDTTAGKPPSDFAALGGYGPRRSAQRLVDPIPGAGADYPAFGDTDVLIGLDGSLGGITGHGDIATPVTAWALHRLVTR
jgi:hypothetical protein